MLNCKNHVKKGYFEIGLLIYVNSVLTKTFSIHIKFRSKRQNAYLIKKVIICRIFFPDFYQMKRIIARTQYGNAN